MGTQLDLEDDNLDPQLADETRWSYELVSYRNKAKAERGTTSARPTSSLSLAWSIILAPSTKTAQCAKGFSAMKSPSTLFPESWSIVIRRRRTRTDTTESSAQVCRINRTLEGIFHIIDPHPMADTSTEKVVKMSREPWSTSILTD